MASAKQKTQDDALQPCRQLILLPYARMENPQFSDSEIKAAVNSIIRALRIQATEPAAKSFCRRVGRLA